jgi:quinol monooxygenase YgiN
MAHLIVHHKVENFAKWKPFFDDHASYRKENGSLGSKVFQSTNDPNEVFVFLEWDNVTNANRFIQSDRTKSVMKEAGVVGIPSIYFVEEISRG